MEAAGPENLPLTKNRVPTFYNETDIVRHGVTRSDSHGNAKSLPQLCLVVLLHVHRLLDTKSTPIFTYLLCPYSVIGAMFFCYEGFVSGLQWNRAFKTQVVGGEELTEGRLCWLSVNME